MSSQEIRYYMGKYKDEVLKKSKGNWLVKALETVRLRKKYFIPSDVKFITCPRLLWKAKK